MLAAQVVKPQARVLAEARGIGWVEVDLAVLRGEREPELTLFGVTASAARIGSAHERRTRAAGEDDGVLTITLNRPQARNAVNQALAEGVAAALDRLDAEDGLRLAILTGAGGTSAPAWT